jgi:hypothetical protein
MSINDLDSSLGKNSKRAALKLGPDAHGQKVSVGLAASCPPGRQNDATTYFEKQAPSRNS